MFKRICLILLILCSLTALCSCADDTADANNNAAIYNYDSNSMENMLTFIKDESIKAIENIDLKKNNLLEKLGDNFEGYNNNKTAVTEFYIYTQDLSDELYTVIKAAASDYCRYVSANLTKSYSDWNDAMTDLYSAWNNALDNYYSAWTSGFEEVYGVCADLLKLGYEELEYSEYSSMFSDMYEEYYDNWAQMYEKYSDTWSQLYTVYSDVWKSFYNGQTDIEDILSSETEASDKS